MKEKDNLIFNLLFAETLNRDKDLRFKLTGSSMHPALREGDLLTAKPIKYQEAQVGDILACQDRRTGRVIVHRLVKKLRRTGALLTMGDATAGDAYDSPVQAGTHIIARVVTIERAKEKINLSSTQAKLYGRIKVVILLAYHAAITAYRKLFKQESQGAVKPAQAVEHISPAAVRS